MRYDVMQQYIEDSQRRSEYALYFFFVVVGFVFGILFVKVASVMACP